jgi:hypothetical protein
MIFKKFSYKANTYLINIELTLCAMKSPELLLGWPKLQGLKKASQEKEKTMIDLKKENENYGKEKQGNFLIGGALISLSVIFC